MGACYSRQRNPSTDNNQTDTVAMARQERERNGPWEAEISYGGEADLHRHLLVCDKNPGHHQFVPVDLFGVDHLPSGCQENLLAEMTRALSDLTVRVSVKYVSEERPETFLGSDKPYPFYRNRGSDMMRVGTGWVWDVEMYPMKYRMYNPTCDCKECMNSPTPKTQFAHIIIRTAAHVVYDGIEGADTTCHLFFDRGRAPDVCEGVIALSGMSSVKSVIFGDWCVMEHATHDRDLAYKLSGMVYDRNKLMDKVEYRYAPRYSELETESELDHLKNLAIIVSHPHGCSKQVSVGYWTGIEGWRDVYRYYTYTTATCPGTSGAHVFVVGEGVGDIYHYHAHSGNFEENKEMNFCCSGWAKRMDPSMYMRCTQNVHD